VSASHPLLLLFALRNVDLGVANKLGLILCSRGLRQLWQHHITTSGCDSFLRTLGCACAAEEA
jgi:hypothetical protein